MTAEADFREFLKDAIWDRTWEDEDDEEGEILSYEVLTLEEAGVLSDATRIGVIAGTISNDSGFVVIAPDRSTFVVTIQQKV
ncbi:MAG: hypothetical protein K8R13_03615 [Methanococcoides sp.]|nr:hypothetical protein [Methanococcoides sp.]